MIKGIGCDVVNIKRIERLIFKYGNNFLERILSDDEILRYKSLGDSISLKSRYVAKRFAAKESVSKAIGSGIGRLAFKEISITNDSLGKPEVNFLNKEVADLYKNFYINISLSDDEPVALAFTIISA